jgi:hypothetical protein
VPEEEIKNNEMMKERLKDASFSAIFLGLLRFSMNLQKTKETLCC